MAVVYIDIENGAGQKQGNGPITSASRWASTARMSKAGDFEFEMPASDPKAVSVRKKYIARAYARLNGQRIEVGAGIIDNIQKIVQVDGTVALRVSGDDLVRELTYRSVKNLKLYTGGNPVTHAAAVAAVGGYAPAGWSFTPDGAPPNDNIYGYFNGETVLQGMVKVAEKSQNHFYRGTGRSLIFASSFTASGVRAIQARGDLSPTTCAITKLTEQIDTYDLITRIYPRGSGNGEVQLTLRATSRVAPAGFTLDAAQNYIENDTAEATYGIIERQVDYRDIGPVENTDADIQAAANMLFDAALETLKRQSTELEQATYTVQLAGCSQLLRPMQSIRMVYRDTPAGLNINADLNILEATWQVDESGLYTTDLVVSNADRWPKSDVSFLVDNLAEGHVYQALPQLNANSYVTAYNKNVDENHIASFRFRFGREVTQLQQVLFEFQILSFESTVAAVGGATSGSGDIPTGGPSTNDTGSGGNNETGNGGPTSTDSTTPTVGSATPTVGSSTPSIGSATPTIGSASPSTGLNTTQTTTTETPSIGSSTGALGSSIPTIGPNFLGTSTGSESLTIGSATPTIGSATPSIGNNSTILIGGTALETENAEGGDIISGGRHQHNILVTLGGTVTYPIGYGAAGTAGGFVSSLAGSSHNYTTNQSGSHTHEITSHTHTIEAHNHTITSHTHTIASHTHTISAHTHTISSHDHTITSHTHTISAHTHTISSHTHTIAAHDHTIASHNHTVAAHTHTIAAHDHTIAAHTHTISAHTHTITAHTHSMSSHTHSLNNHTHDLSESITAIYGIFREDALNTYALTDLDYQVNGGGWLNCEDDAVDAGDGWWQIDITALVMSSTTFRPNQANNILEIRSLTTGKTATIDAQLSVRNIIQAVAYA